MKLSCLKSVKRGVDGKRPEPVAAYVDAAAVLDRSGSMAALLPGAQAGVRIWLEQQKKTVGGFVEVVTFDDIVEKPYCGWSSMMMSADIARILGALRARGMTRLYDTAVETIYRQMKRLEAWRAALPKARAFTCLDVKPVAVLFVLTDGQDNVSRVADQAAFKRALALTVAKWNTVTIFAAANQDAMAAGRAYGFDPETILQMDAAPAAVTAVFRSATASQARACSGVPPRMTPMERMTSAPSQHRMYTAPAVYGPYDSGSDDDDDSAAAAGGGGRGCSGAVTPFPSRAGAHFYPHQNVAFPSAAAAFMVPPRPRRRPQNTVGGGGGARAPFMSPLLAPIPPPPSLRRVQRLQRHNARQSSCALQKTGDSSKNGKS
jgi:hypothetical protein